MSSRTRVCEVEAGPWVCPVTSGSKEQWLGPAGTGKSHILVAGIAAVEAGHRVRYFTAADLVETLYRGLADNSVGKRIETLLRNDLSWSTSSASRRWTTPARSCCSGSSPPLTNADPSASGRTGRSSPGTVPARTHHRRQLLDRLLHHCHTVVTDGDSYRMRQARAKGGTRHQDQLNNHEEWGLLIGHQRGPQTGR